MPDLSVILPSATQVADIRNASINANTVLLTESVLTWNGTDVETNTADIAVPVSKAVLVRINNQSGKAVSVSFYHKVGEAYVAYAGADGEDLTFDIASGVHKVFGPIQGWPRYGGGRIKFACLEAPVAAATITVQAQEV